MAVKQSDLSVSISKQLEITVITRPPEDFKEKDRPALRVTIDVLKSAGINVLFKSNIHQKFAVIDQRVVWYGSINLLSYGNSEESILRLDSPNIASELLRAIHARY